MSGLREALRDDNAPTRLIPTPAYDAPTRVQRSSRRPVALVAAVLALAGAGTAAALALSGGGDEGPRTVVVTETGPGTTQVQTVTVEALQPLPSRLRPLRRRVLPPARRPPTTRRTR